MRTNNAETYDDNESEADTWRMYLPGEETKKVKSLSLLYDKL